MQRIQHARTLPIKPTMAESLDQLEATELELSLWIKDEERISLSPSAIFYVILKFLYLELRGSLSNLENLLFFGRA